MLQLLSMAARKFDCISALKALGEESRLRILRLLLERSWSVGEVAETLALTPYNTSKHLRVLKEAGLVVMEKQAQLRVYALTPEFRSHLSENDKVLDLGCCTFYFDKLPD